MTAWKKNVATVCVSEGSEGGEEREEEKAEMEH